MQWNKSQQVMHCPQPVYWLCESEQSNFELCKAGEACKVNPPPQKFETPSVKYLNTSKYEWEGLDSPEQQVRQKAANLMYGKARL